jgi:hypothetical protein
VTSIDECRFGREVGEKLFVVCVKGLSELFSGVTEKTHEMSVVTFQKDRLSIALVAI